MGLSGSGRSQGRGLTTTLTIVASQLDLKISQILFVGDRMEEDVLGPIAAGASAMPIEEFAMSLNGAPSIYAPANVRELFGRISAARVG